MSSIHSRAPLDLESQVLPDPQTVTVNSPSTFRFQDSKGTLWDLDLRSTSPEGETLRTKVREMSCLYPTRLAQIMEVLAEHGAEGLNSLVARHAPETEENDFRHDVSAFGKALTERANSIEKTATNKFVQGLCAGFTAASLAFVTSQVIIFAKEKSEQKE